MKYRKGSNNAANANNFKFFLCSPNFVTLSLCDFKSLKKSMLPRKTLDMIRRKKIVVVGFRCSKTCVDQINDSPQKTMAMTPLICTMNLLSFMLQK